MGGLGNSLSLLLALFITLAFPSLGKALAGRRDEWIVQGHVGATWQDGQYVRTRDMKFVQPAFEDLLRRMKTDYIDLGMIHYVDAQEDWDRCIGTDYIEYVYKSASPPTTRASRNRRWKRALLT